MWNCHILHTGHLHPVETQPPVCVCVSVHVCVYTCVHVSSDSGCGSWSPSVTLLNTQVVSLWLNWRVCWSCSGVSWPPVSQWRDQSRLSIHPQEEKFDVGTGSKRAMDGSRGLHGPECIVMQVGKGRRQQEVEQQQQQQPQPEQVPSLQTWVQLLQLQTSQRQKLSCSPTPSSLSVRTAFPSMPCSTQDSSPSAGEGCGYRFSTRGKRPSLIGWLSFCMKHSQ